MTDDALNKLTLVLQGRDSVKAADIVGSGQSGDIV